jgi:5-methylcytosine-specific restriction endonuclease McrA
MSYKNKADEIARGKLYRKEHAKEISTQRKIYYQKNKKELSKKARIRSQRPEVKARAKVTKKIHYQKNRKRYLEKRRIYRENNIDKIKKFNKDNRDKINKTERQYNKDHPEIRLRIQSKSYKKMGLSKWNLMAWTNVIRKDKNCSYCDSDKDLHSHHLIPKSKYKDLALNENNGVVLCAICHREHHMLNGIN